MPSLFANPLCARPLPPPPFPPQSLLDDYATANSKIDVLDSITIPPGPRLGSGVVEAVDLCKGFGDRLLIDNLSFAVPPGAIVGVVGANGAGKSTLFKMIVGQDKPDNGALKVGETVSVMYVDQNRELDGAKTVFEEITGGVEELDVGGRKINSRAYCGWFNFKVEGGG